MNVPLRVLLAWNYYVYSRTIIYIGFPAGTPFRCCYVYSRTIIFVGSPAGMPFRCTITHKTFFRTTIFTKILHLVVQLFPNNYFYNYFSKKPPKTAQKHHKKSAQRRSYHNLTHICITNSALSGTPQSSSHQNAKYPSSISSIPSLPSVFWVRPSTILEESSMRTVMSYSTLSV